MLCVIFPFVLCDGLDELPHPQWVGVALEVLLDSWFVGVSLKTRYRFALAMLSAEMSPSLKAASLALSNSRFIHGFSFGYTDGFASSNTVHAMLM